MENKWISGGYKMKLLSDDALLTAYIKALEYKLDPLFISLLFKELQRREMKIPLFEEAIN